MFSKDITTSDAFREMPTSSQSLYFHLGMEADDDGFLDNYRGLMRSINASEDDLRVLLGKRFLIVFPSKVIAVKHWKINNTIQKDRYNPTKHLEEKSALIVKENGSYTELYGVVYNMDTQNRIEEKRRDIVRVSNETQITIEEDKETERPKRESTAKYPHALEVFALWGKYPRHWLSPKDARQRESAENLYIEKGIQGIKDALEWYEDMKKKFGSDPYFPVVVSPYDLDTKWGKLEAFDKKHK